MHRERIHDIAASREHSVALKNSCLGALVLALAIGIGCSGRSTSTSGPVGLADCDEYVTRMTACISKNPAMKAMEPGFKAQQDAWKQMAKTNAATAHANCKAALASLAATPSCQ